MTPHRPVPRRRRPSGHSGAERRFDALVGDRFVTVERTNVGRHERLDAVTQPLQCGFQMFFEEEARVIGADGDTHERRLYYRVRLVPGFAESSRFLRYVTDLS